jgi:hypothetical protein
MQCRRRAFVRRLGTRRRKSQPYSVLWEGVSLKCMFMLCARFMTSRVNVNNAICKRSVHEISFKRSAFDFMHSNKLCRWRYLLSLGEESMRACNINIHLSDTTPLPQSLYGVRSIKPPSSSQPSEDTVPSPVQLHLQGFCFSPLKVDAYSLVFSFPVQLQEVYHLRFLPCTARIRFHDM